MFKSLLKPFGRPKPPPTPPAADLELSSPSPVVEVTDADFAPVVLAADRLVIVDFWAEWCQPCETMSAYTAFLAAEYADRVLVATIDVEEHQATPGRYAVLGLPTLLLFMAGKEVDRIVGVIAYPEIQRRVERWLET